MRFARALAAVAAALLTAAAPGADLIHESLHGLPAGWAPPAPFAPAADGLQAQLHAGQAAWLVPGARLAAGAEGRVTVTLRQTAGRPADVRAGLVFGAAAADTGEFVLLRGDGYYTIGRVTAGRAEVRLAGTVEVGPPEAARTLSVAWRDGQRLLSSAGTVFVTTADGPPAGGGLALWAAGTGTVVFSDLTVSGQSATPAPAPKPPVTPAPPTPSGPVATPPKPPAPTPPVTVPAQRPPPDGPQASGPEAGHVPAPIELGPSAPTPAVTAPPVAAAVDVKLPPLGATLFEEPDFGHPSHPWTHDDHRAVEPDGLRLRADKGFEISGFPFAFGDFCYSARATTLTTLGGTYGLVARLGRDGASGYVFVVREPATCIIARLDAGRPVVLRREGLKLSGAEHRLAAWCVGQTLSFVVDGHLAGQVQDATYAAGGVGLYVDNGREARFSELAANAVTDSPTAVQPPVGPPAPVYPPRGKPLISEKFANPTLVWQQDAQRQLRDGALRLQAPAGQFAISGLADERYSDYIARCAVERLGGPPAGRHGLVVRLQPDGRSGYLLAIGGDGLFAVLRVDPNGLTVLGSGATSVPPGLNTLWARCAGSTLSFGLGSKLLLTVQDGTYGAGGFGLYCDNGAMARFTELAAEALP